MFLKCCCSLIFPKSDKKKHNFNFFAFFHVFCCFWRPLNSANPRFTTFVKWMFCSSKWTFVVCFYGKSSHFLSVSSQWSKFRTFFVFKHFTHTVPESFTKNTETTVFVANQRFSLPKLTHEVVQTHIHLSLSSQCQDRQQKKAPCFSMLRLGRAIGIWDAAIPAPRMAW